MPSAKLERRCGADLEALLTRVTEATETFSQRKWQQTLEC
jgi:hypothetical protein